MNLLLDTHIFLWFVNDDSKLSDDLKDLIEDENTVSFLSVASLWEMSIKYNLGKLTLAPSYEEFIEKEVRQSSIILLNIRLEHLKINASLPFHHRDPFPAFLTQSTTANSKSLGIQGFDLSELPPVTPNSVLFLQ